MSKITLPKAFVPIGHVVVGGIKHEVIIFEEWMRAFEGFLVRSGGTVSDGVTELQVAAFEDAGIAEQQAEIYAVDMRHSQEPPSIPQLSQGLDESTPPVIHQSVSVFDDPAGIGELRERIAVLETAINGLMQERFT